MAGKKATVSETTTVYGDVGAIGGLGKSEVKFSKEQLLASERFRNRRDILNALLSDEKEYTIAEAELKIKAYMEGEVK